MSTQTHHGTFDAATTLETMTCGSCGGAYALAERFVDECRVKGKAGAWGCPYCGTRWGYKESEADRLRKQLKNAETREKWARDSASQWAARAEHQAARAAGYKGAMTKVKKKLSRVQAGVCPECNRTFQNLARHMAHQHGGAE